MDRDDVNFENRAWLEEAPARLFPAVGEQTGALTQEVITEAFRMFGYLEAEFIPFQKRASCRELASYTQPKELIDRLRLIYTGRIGIEFLPFVNQAVADWIEKRFEPLQGRIPLDEKSILHIHELLLRAELFETFLHTKFVGQKRFSLEGAETLIPVLSYIFKTASEQGVDEVVLGMSHRGRLNVLGNIFEKPFEEIVAEFKDMEYDVLESSGDVKYHKGHTSERSFSSDRAMLLTMVSNPSHLESVDAVAQGFARARQKHKKVLPVLIHGDAAISGQGVVYESLQLSKLKNYSCDGTIHIILNNHIGFTTHEEDSRATPFCSDVAKTFGIPVFHVNAENPEVAVWAAIQAVELRGALQTDVFLDLNCYRKYGHNESDEPSFTQPLMYEKIRKSPSIRTLFEKQMKIEAKNSEQDFRKRLGIAFEEAHLSLKVQKKHAGHSIESSLPAIPELIALIQKISTVPEGFSIHPQLKKQLEVRHGIDTVDWGLAEALSFATILQHNIPIRIEGQDTARGTFSQRHAAWIDQKDGSAFVPLSHISEASFEVINSPLSEYATLGFEYGYSIGDALPLVIWEAQFGDFANGAEIIIDQYIAAGESKWGAESGLTLLLPHGYEGQGPEHSSARLERYLQLAAEGNMRIVNPTTPAQYFHLLRRQAFLRPKKPLICMTPKGLLRHPQCKSSLLDLSTGTFQEIIATYKSCRVLLFCQGRVFYDIREHAPKDCEIVRIEEIYPLHTKELERAIQAANAEKFLFVQEEPENAGAFRFLKDQIEALLPSRLHYIGRAAAASPAVASHAMHTKELKAIQEAVRQA